MTDQSTMATYCVNCKHSFQKYPNGEIYCRVFPRINLVTGELGNQFADVARSSATMCGEQGIKFEPKAP